VLTTGFHRPQQKRTKKSARNAGAYCLALVPHLIISPAISIHRSPAAIEHRAVDDWMLNRTVLDPEWRLPARRFRQAAPNRMEWTVPEHHQVRLIPAG
jgi:hypothetical protein